jgi:signal transduction histidine kinase
LVELMALSAANALENAQVHEALQASQRGLERRNKELLVLNEVAVIIRQSLTVDQILNEGLDKVLELTRVDAGWIGLFGPERTSLSLEVSRHLFPGILDKLEQAGVHSDRNRGLILAGEPVILSLSLTGLDLGLEDAEQAIALTSVGVAIRARENLLGVLGCLYYGVPEVDDQDVQLLVAIGHQLGAAIEQIRLMEEASEIEVLRNLDAMRSELIATASHELRTPLGLVRLFATALLMEEVSLDEEASQQFLLGIADESEKLENILDNLLDLSRMESGRLLLDLQPVDVGELVKTALTRMSPELEGRPLQIDVGTEPLTANVDAERIEQVLRNVLTNAIKYSPEKSEIGVRCWHTGEEIAVSVIDRGIGIPAAEQERIFERFYRVDNDLTRRMRGAGLGLSICRWIVEAHGGSIQVFSEPGSGSEFRILLPAAIET